jgi:hypothetical protein
VWKKKIMGNFLFIQLIVFFGGISSNDVKKCISDLGRKQ